VTVQPRIGPDGSIAVEPDHPAVETPKTADEDPASEAPAPPSPAPPAGTTGGADATSAPHQPGPSADGGDVRPRTEAAGDPQSSDAAASVVDPAAARSAVALARLTGAPRSAELTVDAAEAASMPIPSSADTVDGPRSTSGTKPGWSGWHRVRTRLARRRIDARFTVANWFRWVVERWRRSLQLRVAVTTMLLSGLVVIIAGILSVGAISSGVLDSKRNAAHAEVINGVRVIQDQLAAAAPQDKNGLNRATQALLDTVGNRGAAAGLFSIVVVVQGATPSVSGSTDVADVPQQLRALVEQGKFADMFSPVRAGDGTFTKGLIVGAPVPRQQSAVQLYYLFPLEAEQRTLTLVRNTVLLTGILLVALLAVVALMVTRQVVRPVRVAAEVAERFASGRLRERMTVRGEDDLAALAASFNDMADSLQGQITKLAMRNEAMPNGIVTIKMNASSPAMA